MDFPYEAAAGKASILLAMSSGFSSCWLLWSESRWYLQAVQVRYEGLWGKEKEHRKFCWKKPVRKLQHGRTRV